MVGNASRTWEETAEQRYHCRDGTANALTASAMLEKVKGPRYYGSATEAGGRGCLLTLEAGNDTGSNEKFSIRLA